MQFEEKLFETYLSRFSKNIKIKLNRYRRWEDKQASLTGMLLMCKGFEKFNYGKDVINNIKYNEYKRPFVDSKIDFNISHSGIYVVCAISETHKVGIDIEEMKKINFLDFRYQMLREEWSNIIKSKNKTQGFYDYWTKKEAVIKANGKGLSIPLKSFVIVNSTTILEQIPWYTIAIDIKNKNYCCHLACNEKIKKEDVIVEEVLFNKL
jgi:4'-phosphopantetheinyl transferase